MMYDHSPFGVYPFYRNRYYRPYVNQNCSSSTNTSFKKSIPTIQEEPLKSIPKKEESPLFEIFGISLYYDDILILCLLFFLYKEEVKDPYLFISLVLLLLS